MKARKSQAVGAFDPGADCLCVGSALLKLLDHLREYERLCDTSEALIYATMTRLMARRLARI